MLTRVCNAVVLIGFVACGSKLDPVEVESSATGTEAQSAANSGTSTATSSAAPTTTSTTNATTTTTTTGTTSMGLCGTSDVSIGYAKNIETLLANQCTGCHGANGGNKPLDTFANAKATFKDDNGQNQVDSGLMPPSGKMSASNVCLVDAWVKGGYQP